MASEIGAYFAPAPIMGIGVICTPVIGAPAERTSTVAVPGITIGGRIVTKRLYGPVEASS